MAISLRTWGNDNNSAGASQFVGIPVPVGVKDGDLAVVGLAVPAGITVTSPNGWTQAVTTDPSQFGLAIFYATILNAPSRWVFALSAAASATGVVVVYAGVDSFMSIESAASSANASAATAAIPASATSVPGEEVLVFLAAPSASGFTPAAGYLPVVSDSNVTAEIAAHRSSVANPGALAATTAAHGSSTVSVSALLVLRPSAGKLSVDQVRGRILAQFPVGIEETYDLQPGGDYFKYFQAIAEAFKTFAYDAVEMLRSEAIPSRSLFKLSTWEGLFGIAQARVAKVGTVPQRQAQVRAAWRAAARQGSSEPEISAAIGPLLGYNPSTPIELINMNRDALTAAHSYGPEADVLCPASQTKNMDLFIAFDGGKVSSAGARLFLTFDNPDLTGIVITLISPTGKIKEWDGPYTAGPLVLYAPEFAGLPIQGKWRVSITNGSGSDHTLLAGGILHAEGVNPGQRTAGAMFCWGVYADPAHLGENGVAADIAGAERMLNRMKQAHTEARVILSKTPYPDTVGGINSSIPDRCIPA